MALESGTRVGEWVVEEPLDEDGRYRCHRLDTPFRKAVLRVVHAADAETLRAEAQAWSKLQHPNVLGVLGLETSGDDLYLVTESVQGAPLENFVRQPPLPTRAALDLAIQVADALCAAHARGIHHGDVRPRNVIVSADGRATLVGLDLRGSVDRARPELAYLAPEPRPRGVSADAYAFGVLLVELFTGQRVEPVSPDRRTALSIDAAVPQTLRDLAVRLTHPDPEVRASLPLAREALGLALRESLGDSTQSTEATFADLDALPDLHAAPAPPGRIGRYQVRRELGRGGVGVVYEAEDADLRRRVALKVLLAGAFARARDIERFLREARAVAKLDHPGIVKILELGRDDGGGAWFAMEFVDGPTMLDRIRERGRLPWDEAARLASEVAHALEHAHRAGLVHRDVKPSNVLLEASGRARLTDFGLALEDSQEASRLTRTGQVLGTPMYMSPEQAVGDVHRLGPRTDVYGVGVLLYEAMTGRVPYEGATPLQVIGKVLQGEPAAPRTHVPDLPRTIENICLKAMRRDPDDRYPSAGALAEDLERCVRGEPIVASNPTLVDRTRWFVRRNRWALGVAGLVVVTVAGALGGTTALVRATAARAAAAREAAARDTLESARGRVESLNAEGKHDEAVAAWRAFARHDEVRGTHALVDGWLSWADDAARDGDPTARLSALAGAYAAADHPEDQARALLALARGLREERRLDLLPMVLDTLRERVPELADDPEVRRLERDARAAHRDLVGAAARSDDGPLGRALRALSATTRTEWDADLASPWPGGNLMLRRQDADTARVVGGAPSLPEQQRLRLPVPIRAGSLFVLDTAPPRLLGSVPSGGAAMLRVDPKKVHFEQAWTEGEIGDATSADLDGDGESEHYHGAWRQLYRLQQGPAGWTRDVPHPDTQASNSAIEDLVVADLDGDGAQELVVAAAEWGAYDVRRLVWDGADRPLRLAGRAKLGVVTDLVVVRGADGAQELLASKQDRYANRRVFPESSPTGEPQGLYRLRLVDGTLAPERLRPWSCGELVAGDFDGDGLGDVAADCGGDLALLIRRADGDFDDLWLRRLRPLAALQLDDDAPSELVVADLDDDHRVWVLGAGTDEPPLLVRTHHAAELPPEGAPAAFRAQWRRAEDLVKGGQLGEAAETLRALADLSWGRPEGVAALLRSADLLAAAGATEAASRTYLEAAELPGGEDALPAAARTLKADRRVDDERAVLERIRDRGDLTDEQAARLTQLAEIARAPRLVVDPSRPLDGAWQVTDPLAVWQDPAQGTLELEAIGEGVLARMPVRWDGQWFRATLDARVEHLDWAGGVAIGLAPRGFSSPIYGFVLDGRGGGEVVWQRQLCSGGDRTLEHRIPREDRDLRATVELHADGALVCAQEQEGAAPWRRSSTLPPSAPEDLEWDLVIAATDVTSALARVSLKGLTLDGVSPDPAATPATDPHAELRRALLHGEPLAPEPTGDVLLDAAVAARAHDPEALARALAAAGPDDRAALLRHLGHARLAEHGAMLRRWLGPRWPHAFLEAWEAPLAAQSSDREVRDALLRELDGLERVEPTDADEAAELVLLLASRAAAATAAGRDELAQRSLTRADELVAGLGRGGPLPAALGPRLAAARMDAAALAAATGDLDGAFAALEEALGRAPAPTLLADQMAVREALAPLRADPRWESVVERIRQGR